MKKHRKYKQGAYYPINPNKYRGTHPIIYRSGLEKKVMRFFDTHPSIITWGSESVVIPYESVDGKVHKYFTDFVVKIQTPDGNTLKYIIEVKPLKQTVPPTRHGNKKQKTILYEQYMYAVNTKKWDSAKQWCNKNGYIFSIITENDIDKYMMG